MNEQFFSTEDVSRILHVGKSTIKRWTDEGKIKCFRTPGGHRKFKTDFLLDFIQTYHFDVTIPFLVKKENAGSSNSAELKEIDLHTQVAVG